jgi:hypothetical protein
MNLNWSFSGMMEAVRTSETSVDNYFTRQYIPEDNSERKFIKLEVWKQASLQNIKWFQIGHFSITLIQNLIQSLVTVVFTRTGSWAKFSQTTWHNGPEDSLHTRKCEKHKSHLHVSLPPPPTHTHLLPSKSHYLWFFSYLSRQFYWKNTIHFFTKYKTKYYVML